MELYALFALTTAIYLHFWVYVPVMREIEHVIPTPVVIEYRNLTYFSFFVGALLIAPILIIPAVFFHERFAKSLADTLRKND